MNRLIQIFAGIGAVIALIIFGAVSFHQYRADREAIKESAARARAAKAEKAARQAEQDKEFEELQQIEENGTKKDSDSEIQQAEG